MNQTTLVNRENIKQLEIEDVEEEKKGKDDFGLMSMADMLADLENDKDEPLSEVEEKKQEPKKLQTMLDFSKKEPEDQATEQKIEISEEIDALRKARKSVGRISRDEEIRRRRSASIA